MGRNFNSGYFLKFQQKVIVFVSIALVGAIFSFAKAEGPQACSDSLANPKETVKACRELIKQHPEDHAAIVAGVTLGKALEKLNEKKAAIAAYRAVVDLHLRKFSKKISQNSYPMEATNRIGVLLGLTEEAAQEFQKLADEHDDKDTAMVNLIRNYSDCKKVPLKLYADIIWEQPTQEKMLDVFKEIRLHYSNCKLAPYMQFREAELAHVNYLQDKKEEDFTTALEGYKKVSQLSETILFPESRYGESNGYNRIVGHRIGSSINAIALYRIAQLLEDKNPVKAQDEYFAVADRYPDEVNFNNENLGTRAKLAVLKMWLDKHKDETPPLNLNGICKSLLDNKDSQFDGLSIHTQALKYLALYYDRIGNPKEAIQAWKDLLKKCPSNNESFDAFVVRELTGVIVRQSGNYAKALSQCKTLLSDIPQGGTRTGAQFACAELRLKSGAGFLDAAGEFRKIVAENPKERKEYPIFDGGPNLVIQAGRRADSIEKFVTYAGDPPSIDLISSIQSSYKSSSEFVDLLALRSQWVLKNLDTLIAIQLPSLEAVLLKIGEEAIPPLITRYIPINPSSHETLKRILVNMAKTYPIATTTKLLEAYTVFPNDKKMLFAQLFADIGTSTLQKPLEELAAMGSQTAKLAYMKGLAAENTTEAQNILLKLFGDPDDNIKRAAVNYLGNLKQERFLMPLIDILKYPEGYIQMEAADQIAKFGNAAVPLLAQTYKTTSNETQKFFILKTLEKIPTPESFDSLQDGLTDTSEYRRAQAVLSMYAIDPKKTIPYMKRILQSKERLDKISQLYIKDIFKAKNIETN